MKKTLILILFLLITGNASASKVIDTSADFYTPMSTLVTADRTYLLTSNAHAFIDMGNGPESFETMLFLKFDSNSLPDEQAERVWLRMGSGAEGTMGMTITRPVTVSVHNVDMDVTNISDYTVTPRDFYVNENHVLDPCDSTMVFKDGVCYWDVTDLANQWILFEQSGGLEGIENLGMAVTGRLDPNAHDPCDNQHPGFWSSRVDDYDSIKNPNPMPHTATPVMIVIDQNDGFDGAWIPDWTGNLAYTHQHWLLSASNGRFQQRALPDGYVDNIFGDPNVNWEEETMIGGVETINPFLTWHPSADSNQVDGQPEWVDGVYGGLYRGSSYADHTMTAVVPTGTEQGVLTVFVQYDWYDAGLVTVNIDGATDITPQDFDDRLIGNGENGNNWFRSTKVFTINNPGSVDVEFTVSGEEPFIDAFSITTAIDAVLPAGKLRYVADIDMNGKINFGDFAVLAANWQESGDSLKGDCDNNGDIDLLDVVEISINWLGQSNYIFNSTN